MTDYAKVPLTYDVAERFREEGRREVLAEILKQTATQSTDGQPMGGGYDADGCVFCGEWTDTHTETCLWRKAQEASRA